MFQTEIEVATKGRGTYELMAPHRAASPTTLKNDHDEHEPDEEAGWPSRGMR